MQIHSPKELETVFVELLISSKPSLKVMAIYKHPSMQHFKFNKDFMKKLLHKISLEKKEKFNSR